MKVETMIADAVTAGVKKAEQDIRRKLKDACLLQPTYENPFGQIPLVGAKIDEIVQLLLPSIGEIERDKVYRRMASVLRGDNGKDF